MHVIFFPVVSIWVLNRTGRRIGTGTVGGGTTGPGSGLMRKVPRSIIQPICSKSSFGLGFV